MLRAVSTEGLRHCHGPLCQEASAVGGGANAALSSQAPAEAAEEAPGDSPEPAREAQGG